MTPATRLLEAVRSLISEASMCGRDTPERAVRDALVGVRALYPSAHALGDRVSVVYPDERPGFTGVVVGVEFHTDGVDYRVKGDADPDYTVVEAGFVRAAPRTLPLYRAPGVSGGPDWTVEEVEYPVKLDEKAARIIEHAKLGGWVSTPDYDSLTDDEKATLREVSLYRTAKAMEPKRAPIDVFLNNAPFASIPRNEDGALFIDTSPTPDRITVTFRRR